MSGNEISPSGDLVFKPSARAFFIYYVTIAICLIGPRINPDVWLFGIIHFSVPVGTALGLLVIGIVVYLKANREYRVTSRGVVRVWRWPSPGEQEIVWENLGEILVLRGLTQTILQVGNLAFRDKAGVRKLFWYGLLNPKDVKDLIERKRP
jgi:hypothetical protein